MQKLTITAVAAWVDDWYAALALAESATGVGRHLLIQRALDDSGKAIDSETYALSTELGATQYGGIVSWSLRHATLDLALTDEAAHTLSVAPTLQFTLPTAESAERVRRSLTWMLEPTPPQPPDVFGSPQRE